MNNEINNNGTNNNEALSIFGQSSNTNVQPVPNMEPQQTIPATPVNDIFQVGLQPQQPETPQPVASTPEVSASTFDMPPVSKPDVNMVQPENITMSNTIQQPSVSEMPQPVSPAPEVSSPNFDMPQITQPSAPVVSMVQPENINPNLMPQASEQPAVETTATNFNMLQVASTLNQPETPQSIVEPQPVASVPEETQVTTAQGQTIESTQQALQNQIGQPFSDVNANQPVTQPQNIQNSNMQPPTPKKSNGKLITIIIVLLVIIAGVGAAIIYFNGKNNEKTQTEKNINEYENPDDDIVLTDDIYNYLGYEFKKVDPYRYVTTEDDLLQIIGSEDAYIISITQYSYDLIKANDSQMLSEVKELGYDLINKKVSTIENNEFITYEFERDGLKLLYFFNKIDDNILIEGYTYNSSFSIDYNLLNNLSKIVTDVKYVGQTHSFNSNIGDAMSSELPNN